MTTEDHFNALPLRRIPDDASEALPVIEPKSGATRSSTLLVRVEDVVLGLHDCMARVSAVGEAVGSAVNLSEAAS